MVGPWRRFKRRLRNRLRGWAVRAGLRRLPDLDYVSQVGDRVDARRLQVKALVLFGDAPLEWDALPAAVELAKRYGLHGFCFPAGRGRRMTGSLGRFLADPALRLPFCARWDGSQGALPTGLLAAMQDPRYMRVGRLPLLVTGPDAQPGRLKAWQRQARAQGLEGLQCLALAPVLADRLGPGGRKAQPKGPGPALYARHLAAACELALRQPGGRRFVLIHGWDDAAAGAWLTPDRERGYAFLHATANVLRRYHRDPATSALVAAANARFKKSGDCAVVLHCHYEELLAPLAQACARRLPGADVVLSFRADVSRGFVKEAIRLIPQVRLLPVENRGRDIRPFLLALRELRRLGYRYGCKIHSKRSPHQGANGDLWRERLLRAMLVGADPLREARRRFQADPRLGLLAPAGSLMDCSALDLHRFNRGWLDQLMPALGAAGQVGGYHFKFPAGSMFWFRVEAMAGLDDLLLGADRFEPELGQLDGTLAHAVERIVGVYAAGQGYRMQSMGPERAAGSAAAALGRGEGV